MPRTSNRSDIIDVEAVVLHRTNHAALVTDGTVREWLPLSLIEVDEDDEIVSMPEWLAVEKGFV